MKNNDFAMLIVAILFIALASSGMNMITGSSSVTAEAGSVIQIPWEYKYDNNFFGSKTTARMILDEVGFGKVDQVVWTQTVSLGQTYTGSFNYQVPSTEGIYKIRYSSEEWSGSRYTGTGQFELTITVTLPEYEEPEDEVPDETETETPTGNESGIVDDTVPIDQTVEAAILGNSLMDKLSVLWALIVEFFETLVGVK